MADLNKLLSASSTDDLKAILVPVGTWHGRAKMAKVESAEDARTDKNGREYVRGLIAVDLTEPFPDVDRVEVAALNGELADEPLFYSKNLYGKSDIRKFRKILEALGAIESGRTTEEMAAQIKDFECVVEVEHQKDKESGEDRNNIRKITGPNEV